MLTTFSQRDEEQRSSEDLLFEMFKDEKTDLVSVGKFLAALRTCGIRRNDPRMAQLIENLQIIHRTANYEGGSPETQNLNRATFKS